MGVVVQVYAVCELLAAMQLAGVLRLCVVTFVWTADPRFLRFVRASAWLKARPDRVNKRSNTSSVFFMLIPVIRDEVVNRSVDLGNGACEHGDGRTRESEMSSLEQTDTVPIQF